RPDAPPPCCVVLCFFYCSGAHPDLHSFPTRRSSDLYVVARVLLRAARRVGLALGRPRLAPLVDVAAVAVWLVPAARVATRGARPDRKSTRLNSSHVEISYAVFCLKKKIEPSRKTRPT